MADCVLVAGTSAQIGGPVRRQSVGSPGADAALCRSPGGRAGRPGVRPGAERACATTRSTRCHYLIHIPTDAGLSRPEPGPGGRHLPVRAAPGLAGAVGNRRRARSRRRRSQTRSGCSSSCGGAGGDPLPVRRQGGLADARRSAPARPRRSDGDGSPRALGPCSAATMVRRPARAALRRHRSPDGMNTEEMLAMQRREFLKATGLAAGALGLDVAARPTGRASSGRSPSACGPTSRAASCGRSGGSSAPTSRTTPT